MLVDGVDVRELDPELLWSRIGLVPQKPYLFSGTVASNLRYGDPDATDEELWEALEIAQAADFVRPDARRPRGAHHPGRHQRLRRAAPAARHRAGARAQARASTSSTTRSPRSTLATDARLRAALRPVTAEATVLIVAQRVSTHRARRPDPRARGRPSSSGSAPTTSCSRRCPTYAEIVESQRDRRGGGMSAPPRTAPRRARCARREAAPAARAAASAARDPRRAHARSRRTSRARRRRLFARLRPRAARASSPSCCSPS